MRSSVTTLQEFSKSSIWADMKEFADEMLQVIYQDLATAEEMKTVYRLQGEAATWMRFKNLVNVLIEKRLAEGGASHGD